MTYANQRNFTKSVQESLERLQEYDSELLSQNIITSSTIPQYIEELRKPTCMELDETPTPDEFNAVLKHAKTIFTVEILKHAKSKLLKLMLLQLIIQIWESTKKKLFISSTHFVLNLQKETEDSAKTRAASP